MLVLLQRLMGRILDLFSLLGIERRGGRVWLVDEYFMVSVGGEGAWSTQTAILIFYGLLGSLAFICGIELN